MGRRAGVCGGRGGSQHLAWRGFHSNGVQGGMTAIGAGAALARKRRGDGGIVAVFVGDGTMGEGLFYESLNLSSVWDLPVLFVIENNGIAQTTPVHQAVAGSFKARGEAFGIRAEQISDDSEDFLARAEDMVRRVRETRHPGLLVIATRRLGPHSKGDDLRSEAELDAIARRDPLCRLGEILDAGERAEIEKSNHAFLDEICARAQASPPARDDTPSRSIFTCIPPPATEDRAPEARSPREALNVALDRLLRDSSDVLLLGEDLHDPYGGAFKVTAGLSTAWPGRVLSTPISEAALTGCAIGLAMNGFRPVVEIMFADFLTLAVDQLYNHAVKFPALSPELRVPLVIRTPSGGRRGYGPTHSQSTESLACGVPGLTVVFPSQYHDSGRLLEESVAWPYPTVFFEHKLLYGSKMSGHGYQTLAPHPEDIAADRFPTLFLPAGERPDLTIVTYGAMAADVEAVARRLQDEEELEVEIIVPCLLAPLPRHTLGGWLASRKRLAVVEEAHCEYGIGAEIVASLTEQGFAGRVVRIATPPVPVPSARSLEAAVIPGREEIRRRILGLFE